jgi:hypothetical protein
MSSQAELPARSGRATVCVERSVRGGWEVLAPGGARPIACETLEDAEREAYRSVARTHARELIVRDAYHRVLHYERIERNRAVPLSSWSPVAASTQSTNPGGH